MYYAERAERKHLFVAFIEPFFLKVGSGTKVYT